MPTATPTVNPGWTIEIVKEALDTPLDLGEGRTLTERVTEIDYTATLSPRRSLMESTALKKSAPMRSSLLTKHGAGAAVALLAAAFDVDMAKPAQGFQKRPVRRNNRRFILAVDPKRNFLGPAHLQPS